MRQDNDDTHASRLPKGPSRPLLLPAMSDTPDRNDDTPHTTQTATRGRLFDTAAPQVWAIDGDGTWRYLPTDATADAPADDGGETWRALAKAGALHCPYPDCDATFSGVRKGAGRVAFVHPKTGTPHTGKAAKQQLWQIAGVQSVRQWARLAYPGCTVSTDGIDLTPTPDVLVTTSDGTRLAVQLLAESLPEAEWKERSEAYRAAGVTAVWLLANTGPFAKKATGSELLRPAAPVAAALAAGAHVGWLNPFAGLVGTAGQDADPTALAVTEVPIEQWRLDAAGTAPAPSAESSSTADAGTTADAAEPATTDEVTQDAATTAADRADSVTGDATTSEAPKPASTKSDSAKSDSAKADAAKADGAKADAAKPGAAKADGAKPDGAKADAAKPDAAKSEAAKVGSAQADAVTADSGASADGDAAGSGSAAAVDGGSAEAAAGAEHATTGTKTAVEARTSGGSRASGARPAARPQRSGSWLRRMLDRLRRPAA